MEGVKIYFWDKVLAKIFFPLIPFAVKPNHLSVFRLFLTPFVAALIWHGYYKTGTILFLLTAFTDALDGALARQRNQITDLGKLLDPLADKFLIGSTVFVLVFRHVGAGAGWIILILEALIILSALIKKLRGSIVESNVWGKIKMNLQVLGILILLVSTILDVEKLAAVSDGIFYLAIAFGVMSLFTLGL